MHHDYDKPLGKLDFTASMRKFRAQRLRTDAMLVGAGLEPHPPTPAPTIPPNSKLLLTVKDAAAYTGLSGKRIRQLVNRGILRSTRFGTGKTAPIYIHRKTLDEYIAGLPLEESMRRPRRA